MKLPHVCQLLLPVMLSTLLMLPVQGVAQSQDAQNIQRFLNQMQQMMNQQMNQQRQTTAPRNAPLATQSGDHSGAQSYMSPALQALHREVNTRIPHNSARLFDDTRKRFPASYAVLLGVGMQKQMQMLNQRGGSKSAYNSLEQEIIGELHAVARFNGNRNPSDGKPLDGTRLEKDYLGARMGYSNDMLKKHGIDVNALVMQYVIPAGASQVASSPSTPKPVESRPVTGKPAPTSRPVEGRPVSAGQYQYKPLDLPDVEDF